MAQNTRALSSARQGNVVSDLSNAYDATLFALMARQPKRSIFSSLRDFAIVAAGWAMLIGLIAYPAAHLIGLFAASVAVVASPSDTMIRH